MRKRSAAIRTIVLMGVSALVLGWGWPARTAEVTPDRLANPDKEPHNWLMNHRSYDAQRFSPLAQINKDNVKNLKLAYAVAIGGTSANENLQATPLVEDGFMYVVDQWGVLYKIDVRSGDMGSSRLHSRIGRRNWQATLEKVCRSSTWRGWQRDLEG
jgi:alcohol dehydrogenase (cytochrome c)